MTRTGYRTLKATYFGSTVWAKHKDGRCLRKTTLSLIEGTITLYRQKLEGQSLSSLLNSCTKLRALFKIKGGMLESLRGINWLMKQGLIV
jgi:hypothetical protein